MIEQTIDKYTYKTAWSNELSDEQISSYVNFYMEVFHTEFSDDAFKTKFLDNIYGPSVHVLVYDGDKLAAIRSLWRNDLGSVLAYQPCDTAVSSDHRGSGIFKIMTDAALAFVPDAMIYNYPNENSRKLYLRNGWSISRTLNKNLYTRTGFEKNCPDESIPDDYVNWYFAKIPSLCVARRGKYYFLISPKGKGMYVIIGKVSEGIFESGIFQKKSFPILFFRSSRESKIKKLNHPTYIVAKGDYEGIIPSWKVDAV